MPSAVYHERVSNFEPEKHPNKIAFVPLLYGHNGSIGVLDRVRDAIWICSCCLCHSFVVIVCPPPPFLKIDSVINPVFLHKSCEHHFETRVLHANFCANFRFHAGWVLITHEMPSSQTTAWMFTLNNYTDEECAALLDADVKGITAGFETAPTTGTPHIQGCVCFHEKASMKKAKTILGCKRLSGMEPVKATWEVAKSYCKKGANHEKLKDEAGLYIQMEPFSILCDRGDGPEPGKRNDVVALIAAAADITREEEAVWDEMPGAMARMHRAFEKRRDVAMRKRKRTEMTKCIWIWGKTGVGKSHLIFTGLDDEYVHESADKGWWDGYNGESVVVLNEFRGEIPYAELLTLVDKWPKKVSRRGREPTPFLAKVILVSACMPPDKVYCQQNQKEDSIEQLLRRCTVVEIDTSVSTRRFVE